MKRVNLIGREVGRLRYQRGWTQDELADLLQKAGWLISRSGVSKIEAGSFYVPDFRLFYFAHVFRVDVPALLPPIDLKAPIQETMLRFIRNERRGMTSDLVPDLPLDDMKRFSRKGQIVALKDR